MDADLDGLVLQRILGVPIPTLAAPLSVFHAGIEVQGELLDGAESRMKVEPPTVVRVS